MARVEGMDGPTLRLVRRSVGISLREVARRAGVSHGHLSRMERGDPERPVTTETIAAYRRAGIPIPRFPTSPSRRPQSATVGLCDEALGTAAGCLAELGYDQERQELERIRARVRALAE